VDVTKRPQYMKTITESEFSKVENEALKEKLYQLSCEFDINYIFYQLLKKSELAHITIVTTEP